MIGRHLAHDPSLGRLSRVLARAFGTAEMGLRTRTAHVLRAARDAGGTHILDAGCGAGFTALALAMGDPRVELTGVDVNEEQIDHAGRIATEAGLLNAEFVTSFDAVPEAHYDVALCVDTIEYVSDPASFLSMLLNRLRPGGTLVLHCRRTPTPRILKRFERLDPLFDERLRPGYEAGELRDALVAAGFELVQMSETMRFTAELAFELSHPEHGPIRSRLAKYALLPGLVALARLDRGGRGAGLLAVARRLQ
jgi:cyclopropane fatty-acyl-phospholipid synthase-like methyltransferase